MTGSDLEGGGGGGGDTLREGRERCLSLRTLLEEEARGINKWTMKIYLNY